MLVLLQQECCPVRMLWSSLYEEKEREKTRTGGGGRESGDHVLVFDSLLCCFFPLSHVHQSGGKESRTALLAAAQRGRAVIVIFDRRRRHWPLRKMGEEVAPPSLVAGSGSDSDIACVDAAKFSPLQFYKQFVEPVNQEGLHGYSLPHVNRY